MKVGISDRCVPANHDVATNTQFLLAKEHRVGEVAEIPDLDRAVASDGEVDTIHGAVPTHLEARIPVVRLRRPGHRLDPDGPAPDHEVGSVTELPEVLAALLQQ